MTWVGNPPIPPIPPTLVRAARPSVCMWKPDWTMVMGCARRRVQALRNEAGQTDGRTDGRNDRRQEAMKTAASFRVRSGTQAGIARGPESLGKRAIKMTAPSEVMGAQ
jgi:hypothetical protein